MSATTTIRLSDEMKSSVAAAARHAGTTAHGFIVEAITEKIDREDARADFDAQAEARYARIAASGKTIPWREMRVYLESRVAGKVVELPVARKLAH